MKKLLIFPVVAMALLSSCSRYQMNTLRSSNTQLDQKTGVFQFENDSVKILYSFAGHNAPIHINIYNKLNEPIYVDWERSAYIIDDKSSSYADETLQVDGVVSGTTIGRSIRFSDANISAQITLPKNVAFVPPHTQINKIVSKISGQQLNNISDSLFTKTKLPTSYGSGSLSVKMANFDQEHSPFFFKSYLTLYTLNNNAPRFTTYQNDFYISQVIRSSLGPESFEEQSGRGDSFESSTSN
jgi:hypothetical protein